MASRKQQTVNGQAGLFDDEVRLLIPQRLAVEGKVLGSPVRQLEVPASLETCRLRPFAVRRVNGYETTLSSGETLKIISNKTSTELEADLVLLVPEAAEPKAIVDALEAGQGRWINITPTNIAALDRNARNERLAAVSRSWQDAFHLREGKPATNDNPAQHGLRRPQVGALHAALAHSTRSTTPPRL